MSVLLVLPLTLLTACASHEGPRARAHPLAQEAKTQSKDAQSAQVRYEIMRRAVQGASQKDFEAWPRLWATIKAGAPETDPPSRISVRPWIESTDATAEALLNSFVKRELRSMNHVSIAGDQEYPHCVIHIKALVARRDEGDALYFLSFLVTRRYAVTDEGIRVSSNIPQILSEKDVESEEFWATGVNARSVFGLYIAACHSTIYVPVVHDTAIVKESELKKAMELTLAEWDSEIFEPTVQNVRGSLYIAEVLRKAADALGEELEKREREEQTDQADPAQTEHQRAIKP